MEDKSRQHPLATGSGSSETATSVHTEEIGENSRLLQQFDENSSA
jgi:hypothetical protein